MRLVKLPIPDDDKAYFFEEDKTGDGRFMLTFLLLVMHVSVVPSIHLTTGGRAIPSSLCQVASPLPPPPPAVNYAIIIIRLSLQSPMQLVTFFFIFVCVSKGAERQLHFDCLDGNEDYDIAAVNRKEQ